MTKTNQKIPDGWSVKKLGELCLNSPDYGLNESAVPFNRDLPLYLRITDISEDGKYINEGRVSVKYYKLEKLLSKNNLLFARTGATVGKTYLHGITNEKIAFAGYLIRFILDENKINPYFLFLYSRTQKYWNWVKVYSMRSGQPGINSEEYSLLPILLPPLAEQKKIAEILSCWDEGIEKLSALIEKKKIQKKALMQQLLTGKHRIKGFSKPWKNVKLKNVCNIIKGSQLGKLEMLDNGSFPVMNGGVIPSGLTDSFNQPENTITISEGGNSCGFISLIKEKFWCGGHCYALKNLKMNLFFLFQILKSKESSIMKLRVGSGLPNIQRSSIENFSFYIPETIEEQKAIADILSKADEEIELLNKKLEAFKLEKKALMQKLLTGKIRVKVN